MKICILAIFLCFQSVISLAESPKKVLILGDSLSEGYGVSKEAAYPELLQKKITEANKNWSVVNSSVSGSTTSSAPGRLKWQVKNRFDLLILALGANDGLRGISTQKITENLKQTIEMAQKENIKVVLLGMKMPPNYGGKYAAEFEKVFSDLAKKYKLDFIPFFLDGVAGNKDLNQTDGIHPNEKGHKILSENVYKGIEKLL